MSWNDFNDADEQQNFDLIPNRTPVKVHLKIRPGGYNDPSQGWTGGLATRSDKTGAIYLNGEFTVIGGKFDKRKVFSLIGLHSAKGDAWAKMGKSFIRAALESARGVKPDDASERAMQARRVKGLDELDGLEFCALVEVDSQDGYDDKNVIQKVISVGHKDYQALMSGAGTAPVSGPVPAATGSKNAAGSGKPAWMD